MGLVLTAAASFAGLTPVPERRHLLLHGNQRPGDITLATGLDTPHTLAYDVSISDTLQQKTIRNAAAETGFVAKRAFQSKMSKYAVACSEAGVRFVPLIWESTGGSSDSVHDVVAEWSELSAARTGMDSPASLSRVRSGLYRRLSVVLQRSQAITVLERLRLPQLLPPPPIGSPLPPPSTPPVARPTSPGSAPASSVPRRRPTPPVSPHSTPVIDGRGVVGSSVGVCTSTMERSWGTLQTLTERISLLCPRLRPSG